MAQKVLAWLGWGEGERRRGRRVRFGEGSVVVPVGREKRRLWISRLWLRIRRRSRQERQEGLRRDSGELGKEISDDKSWRWKNHKKNLFDKICSMK